MICRREKGRSEAAQADSTSVLPPPLPLPLLGFSDYFCGSSFAQRKRRYIKPLTFKKLSIPLEFSILFMLLYVK
jgi:hypothetical protein